MYCTKCGNSIDINYKFCTKCGEQCSQVTKIASNQITRQEQIQIAQLKMQQQQLQIQVEQARIQQEQFDAQLRCSKCGSTSISGNKKGYGIVKGGLGALILGGATLGIGTIVGAAAGNIGRNKVMCTCMNCGHKFKAGKK